jgi:hypothetical protein
METRTVTLTDFVLARIAEDEADAAEVARQLDRLDRETALNGPDGSQGSIVASLLVGGAFDPARVLAECEAKRRIIEYRYSWNLQAERTPEPPFGAILQTQVNTADAVLRALALPYADHEDYDESWRP